MSTKCILDYDGIVEMLKGTCDSTNVGAFYEAMKSEMKTDEGKQCELRVFDAGDEGWMISYLDDYKNDFMTCWDRARNAIHE